MRILPAARQRLYNYNNMDYTQLTEDDVRTMLGHSYGMGKRLVWGHELPPIRETVRCNIEYSHNPGSCKVE